MRKNNILYKIVVVLLIFCMVFEGGAMQVLASEYDDNVSSNPNIISDTDVSSESDNDFMNNNSDSDSSLDNNANADSDSNSGDNSNSGSDNDSDDNSSADNNDNSDDNGSSDSDDNDVSESNGNSGDNENPDTAPSEDDVTDDSELTENDEIDETDADSSESDSINDDIEKAETAFSDIASNKPLMALIYLTDAYHVRSLADTDSAVIADLESGHTVYILDITITPDTVWYKAQFWVNGVQKEGYVEHIYLAYADEDWLKWTEDYLYKLADDGILDWSAVGGINTYAASYADVDQFPAGYQNALTQLKSSHPNWTFVPMDTKLDFETVVSNEMGVKSLIKDTTSNPAFG